MQIITLHNKECPDCQSQERSITLHLKPSGLDRNWPAIPKYVPILAQRCFKCKRHMGFVPQTDELITAVNNQLEEL